VVTGRGRGAGDVRCRGLSEHLVPGPVRSAVWGGLHFVSVGLPIGVASAVADLVRDTAVWPIGGFLATAVYLLGSASQLAAVHRPGREPGDHGASGAGTALRGGVQTRRMTRLSATITAFRGYVDAQ
jgi:hypothetical protein